MDTSTNLIIIILLIIIPSNYNYFNKIPSISRGLQVLQDTQASERRRNQMADLALQRILDHHLSSKFAFMSRLDRTDLIVDGFFDVGTPLKAGAQLPSIDTLLTEPLHQKKPSILVNAKPEYPPFLLLLLSLQGVFISFRG